LKRCMIETLIRPTKLTKLVKLKPVSLGQDGEQKEDIFARDRGVQVYDTDDKLSVPPAEFTADFVYGPLTTAADVLTRHLGELVSQTLSGISTVFLVSGSHGSGKSWMLDGRNGVRLGALHRLFDGLEDRRAMVMSESPASSFVTTLKIHHFEICNESITDLLGTSAGAPELKDTALDGVGFMNLVSVPVSTVEDGVAALMEAERGRSDATKRTSTVTVFEVLQADHRSGDALASRMMIVETLAIDCLAEDKDRVQLRDGFSAFRSAFALRELSANWQQDRVGDVHTSVLTHLLRDVFAGGNVVGCVMMCVRQFQHAVSRAALGLLASLGAMSTNPVTLDQRLAGYARAQRAELLQCREALAMAQQAPGGRQAPEDTLAELRSLEKRLLDEEMARVKAVDQARQASASLEVMKEKYKHAVTKQAETQKQMIESEEERLRVCQALVQMQMKLVEAQDGASENKYQESKRVIELEQDVLDLTAQSKKQGEQLEELRLQLSGADDDKTALEVELAAVRKSLDAMSEQCNSEKRKAEELAVELVNAVNAKNQAEADVAREKGRVEATGTNIATLEKALGDLQSEVAALREKNEVLQREASDAVAARVGKELEAEKLQVEFEGNRVSMEKGLMEAAKVREGDLEAERQQHREVLEHLQQEVRSACAARDEALQSVKYEQRQAKEFKDLLRAATEGERRQQENVKRLEDEIATLSRDRQKDLADLAEKVRTGESGRSGIDDVLARMVTLADAAAKKEKQLVCEKSRLQAELRKAQDDLIWTQQVASDWAPAQGSEDTVQRLQEIARNTLVQGEYSQDIHPEAALEKEHKALQAQFQTVKAEYAKIQQTSAKEVQKLQNLVAARDSDIKGLRQQIDALHRGPALDVLPQMNQVQQQLLTEVQALRRQPQPAGHNDDLLERNRQLEKKLATALTNGSSEDRNLQARVSFLQENLSQVEQERSKLLVRCTVAEEQLEQLQIHMKQLVEDNTKVIVGLRAQLNRG